MPLSFDLKFCFVSKTKIQVNQTKIKNWFQNETKFFTWYLVYILSKRLKHGVYRPNSEVSNRPGGSISVI